MALCLMRWNGADWQKKINERRDGANGKGGDDLHSLISIEGKNTGIDIGFWLKEGLLGDGVGCPFIFIADDPDGDFLA